MIAYLMTFAIILLVLYSAVHLHMILGLHRSAKKEDLASHQSDLHEALFGN